MSIRHKLALTCVIAGCLFLLTGSLLPAYASGVVQFTGLDGLSPNGPLVADSYGNQYGTTYGGSRNEGTVFKLSPTGAISFLHVFTVASDGGGPGGGLAWGTDGALYGTMGGGLYGSGAIFRITTSGVLTDLYNFSALSSNYTNSDGAGPIGPLALGADGNLYGVTGIGGANDTGTIFKITPSGAFTTLHTFSALNDYLNADGASPQAGMVQGPDGDPVGIAFDGGTAGFGTLFKITPDGTFTLLHTFSSDEYNPEGLMVSKDGTIYGTTYFGEVFKITSGDNYSVWTGVPCAITSALTLGPDGNFYGGGYTPDIESGYGLVFKITPQGTASVLYRAGGSEVSLVIPFLNGTFLFTMSPYVYQLSPLSIDFNADGYPDLMWQNEGTGEVVYTLMHGLAPESWGDIYASFDPNWKIVGVPNFWGPSGCSGLLWQNISTGEVAYIPMFGTNPTTPIVVFPQLDPHFKIVGTPDLNQDGYPDILWENTQTGEVVYALMENPDFRGFNIVPLAWGDLFAPIDPTWMIVGTPDLNGDGHPDLLFQNMATGDVAYALMSGLSVIQWGTLFTGIDPNFQVVGTTDLNGDGYPDIIWENRVTGEVVYTLMQDTTPISWGDLFTGINPQFQLVGLH